MHSVTLATHARAQVDDQPDHIEPVRLRAPLVALDRNTRRIDDVELDVSGL
nr:hypothetical protein [Trinickia mobilis]